MAGYAGGGSSSKWLTAKEISTWLALGSDTGIAALFEITGREPIDNPASGATHAKAARTAWRNLGYPDECSISPAVDEDVTATEAKAQLTQYFSNWVTTDTALPIPYVEMDAGAILYNEKITAGTFTPAAYDWDPSHTLVTPDNAPSHVVWTQEHNGQWLAGGNVDTGHIRVSANIQWKGKAMVDTDIEIFDVWATLSKFVGNGSGLTPYHDGDGHITMVPYATRDDVKALQTSLDNLSTSITALTAAVAKIPTTALPSAPIDIDALATAIVKATPPVHGTFTETE